MGVADSYPGIQRSEPFGVVDFLNRKFDDQLGCKMRECMATIIDSHGQHMSTPISVYANPIMQEGSAELEFIADGIFTVLRSAEALYIGIFTKAGKHVYRQALIDIGQQQGLLAAGSKIAWITSRDELKNAMRSACEDADEAFR